jgi:hypothetical protein
MVYRNPTSIDTTANSKIAQSRDGHIISYQVVFLREGHNIETLYWAGPLEETRQLAQRIALLGGADAIRIVELSRKSEGARLVELGQRSAPILRLHRHLRRGTSNTRRENRGAKGGRGLAADFFRKWFARPRNVRLSSCQPV